MTDVELAILNERVINLDLQMKRFISHLESEQRVYGGHSNRIDDLRKDFQTLVKQMDKVDNALFNGGRGGIYLDVDRLKGSESRRKANIAIWMSVGLFVFELVKFILTK